MEVAEEVCDNKPAPGPPFFCMFLCDPDRGRGAVDARDIEPETGKIDRIGAGTAAEINGPAGPDNALLHQIYQRIGRGLPVPGNGIEG